VGSGRHLRGSGAAIVAATIAYRAAQSNARRQQFVDRKVQWRARARWALERALSDDRRTQAIGLGMLEALGRSERAGEHEEDLVDVVLAEDLGREVEIVPCAHAECPGSGGRSSTTCTRPCAPPRRGRGSPWTRRGAA
jgi:hypothetical protein